MKNGKRVMKLTSNKNGHILYLPISGYYWETSLIYEGTYGLFWADQLYTSSSTASCNLYLKNNSADWTGSYARSYGQTIRPVSDRGLTTPVTGIALNKDEVTLLLSKEETTTLSVTFTPYYASCKEVIWSSSDPTVAFVDYTGKIYSKKVGTSVITATSYDGGFTASCTVTVVYDGQAFLDMDIPSGMQWAMRDSMTPDQYALSNSTSGGSPLTKTPPPYLPSPPAVARTNKFSGFSSSQSS